MADSTSNALLDIANNGAMLNQALSDLTTNVAKLSSITLPLSNGGTGATSAADARTNLQLGSLALQNANNVNITGGSISGISFSTTGSTITGATISGGTISGSAISGGTISGLTSPLDVASGGTGVSSLTAYSLLAGGTTSTGNIQSLGSGTSGQVLTSSGSSALPVFQTITQSQVSTAFNATGSAPFYACRAWVNFNGTGSNGTNQTIRGSGNVSSVYKNATGDYTINFTTAMSDANYAVCGSGMQDNGLNTSSTAQTAISLASSTTVLVGSVRVLNANINDDNNVDGAYITVTIFR